MAEETKASDIMTAQVLTVKPDDDVERVARMLLENNISGLPVVDDENKVIGIITEGDLIARRKKITAPPFAVVLDAIIYFGNPNRYFDELKRAYAQKVEDVMTKKVHTVSPDATIEDIATLMIGKGVNRVPVVDEEGIIQGIITRQDILKSGIPI